MAERPMTGSLSMRQRPMSTASKVIPPSTIEDTEADLVSDAKELKPPSEVGSVEGVTKVGPEDESKVPALVAHGDNATEAPQVVVEGPEEEEPSEVDEAVEGPEEVESGSFDDAPNEEVGETGVAINEVSKASEAQSEVTETAEAQSEVTETAEAPKEASRPEVNVVQETAQIHVTEGPSPVPSTSMAELPTSRLGTGFGPRPATSGKNYGSEDERPMTRSSKIPEPPPLPHRNLIERTAPSGSERPFSRGVNLVDRPPLRHSMGMDRPDTRQSSSSYGDRPTTRQGQGDGMSRPTTSGRPITARPVSAALRGAPGTASRLLSSASLQRPGTRTGVATGIGFSTPINVVDRPITQQGLSGMKTGSRGPQRQVQDKSYFMGLLRTKITDLGSEITRLSGDIESMKQEQSTFLTYDKRVKEMAQELTELQGALGDFNLLLDLINTDTEKLEIDEETKELKDTNQETGEKLDALFTRKQDLEVMMRQLEGEIEEERHMGESLVEAMKPELRNKYLDLRNVNNSLLQHLDQMQHNLDALDNRKASYEDELSMSKVKQDAVVLYEKLQELEEKRAEIINENQKRGTPKEERERLLLQVKEDNGEIAAMERQMGEAQEQIRSIQEDIHHLDQDLEENQSERSQKYRELRKREETMDQFLSTFDENKSEEILRLDALEKNNVALLEKLSRNMAHFAVLPHASDFDIMRSDLAFKEGELEKSKYTEQGLQHERLNLQSNLQKIEALETKVQNEMVELKEKLGRMEGELVEYSDLDGLKTKLESRRRELISEKDELDARRTAVKQNVEEIVKNVNEIKSHLNENETYAQLNSLEKKWAHLEQTNFTLREFVAQKRAESNFLPLKTQALNLVAEYNKTLQEVVQSTGAVM